MLKLINILFYAFPFLISTGIVIHFILIKKSKSLQNWAVTYFFALNLVFLLDLYSIEIFHNNLYLIIIYSLLEVIFYTYLFQKILFAKKNLILLLCSLVAIIFNIFELISLDFQNFKEFQSYSRVVSNMIIATYAANYFIFLLKNLDFEVWENFGLNSVILIYFSVQSIMFLPFNFYSILDEYFYILVILINTFTNLAFYILLIYFIYSPLIIKVRHNQLK